MYVVLRATESGSAWRVLVGVIAAAAAFLSWVSPALVALLLWWVWAPRRSAGDPSHDDGNGPFDRGPFDREGLLLEVTSSGAQR